MGLIDVSSALPNNTKCSTWKDVKHSHTSKRLEKLLLQDVYGTLILLAIGLTGAAMALATAQPHDRVINESLLKKLK